MKKKIKIGGISMKKNAKKLLISVLLTLMIITVLVPSSFAAALENGEYTINVNAVNSSTGEVSLSDKHIKKPATLVVQDGKIHVILTMNTSSMTNLEVQNSTGGFDAVEVISENIAASEVTYKLAVTGIDGPVAVQTTVAAMGRAAGFNLVFDKATLVSTAKAVESKPETTKINAQKIETTNSDTIQNPKTGDPLPNTLFALLLMAMGASVITIFVYRAKEKGSMI